MFSEDASESSGVNFDISVASQQGDLEIHIPISPACSLQRIDARTVKGNALLQLPPAYEGSFWLESQQTTIKHRQVEDPAGRGRKRCSKIFDVGRNIVLGIVYWEPFDNDRPMGWVSVQSTYGHIEAIF